MLNLLAVFLVCSGIGIAVHIAIDLTHRPQSMKIMNAVWILTALWGSYLALWAYNKFGKSVPMKMGEDEMKWICQWEICLWSILIGSPWLYLLYTVEQAAHWLI